MACGYGTIRTAAVRIWHQVSRRAVQRSQLRQNLTIPEVNSCSILNAPPSLQVLVAAPYNTLAESESTLLSSKWAWKRLEVLRSIGEVDQSVWEVCMRLLDRVTFCWCYIITASEKDQGYVAKWDVDRSLELLWNEIWSASVAHTSRRSMCLPTIGCSSSWNSHSAIQMIEHVIVYRDGVMMSKCMLCWPPQGPVSDWLEDLHDIHDDGPLIWCCEEW
jgi:hypothetical protein